LFEDDKKLPNPAVGEVSIAAKGQLGNTSKLHTTLLF